MRQTSNPAKLLMVGCLLGAATFFSMQGRAAVAVPPPAFDTHITGPQSVVLAGGCFWGMQDVFQHVKGVTATTVGYAGGAKESADYETVSTGQTGHAESLEIKYDPAQVSFGQLLNIYFTAAIDPTELNYQGPDRGPQYRSEIFFTTPEQQKIAVAYIAQLDKANTFGKPVVTLIAPLQGFYKAENYHQNYAAQHPDNPYIAINDTPKVSELKKRFPQFYVGGAS